MSRNPSGGAVDIPKAVRTIRYAGMFIAAVPGLVVLLGGYAYPAGLKGTLGAVTTIVPPLAVMLLTARWASVRQFVAARLVGLTAWTVVAFLGSLGVLNLVHKHCVVVPEDDRIKRFGPLLYPLWLTGNIAEEVGVSGRHGAVRSLGYTGVREALDDMPWGSFAWAVTVTTLLLLHLSVSVSVTAAFALLAFHLSTAPPASPPEVRPDPPPLAPLPAQPDPEKGGAD